MGSTTSIPPRTYGGHKVPPIIRTWGQLKDIEKINDIDPNKPVYTLQPIYQDGRIVAWFKIERVARNAAGGEWGPEELGYNKPIEGLPKE